MSGRPVAALAFACFILSVNFGGLTAVASCLSSPASGATECGVMEGNASELDGLGGT